MDSKTQALFEARARIIKSLAHPTRLYIVDLLSGGERCVQEIAGKVDADLSTVSKHLSVLKNTGIVKDEKIGQKVYYRLRVPCVLNFFSCVESVMASALKEQAELLK